MKVSRSILLIIPFYFFASMLSAAVVVTDDSRIQGKLVGQTAREVVIDTDDGSRVLINKAEVREIIDDDGKKIQSASPTPAAGAASPPLADKNPNKDNPLRVVEFDLEYVPGSLVSGNQYKLLNDGLSPKPTSLNNGGFGLSVRIFPVQFLGLGVRYNNSTVTASTQSESLKAYSISAVSVFGTLRYLFESRNFALELQLGPQFAFFDMTSDLRNLILTSAQSQGYSISLYTGDATGVGLAIRASLQWYIQGPVYRKAGVEFVSMPTKYSGATTTFDGQYWNFPIGVGLSY